MPISLMKEDSRVPDHEHVQDFLMVSMLHQRNWVVWAEAMYFDYTASEQQMPCLAYPQDVVAYIRD